MKKVRTLDFYGYSDDSTMIREKDYFPVSKVEEIRNQKYVKVDDEEEDESTESGDTVDNG